MADDQTLNEDQVRHVAKLSRLKLADEEIPFMAGHLGRILDYVARLNELDVTDVEPMAHPTPMTNCLRADDPGDVLDLDAIRSIAPQTDGPFLQVPKVLGDGPGA